MWKRPHVRYQLLLSDFNKTWIFSTDFSKQESLTTKFIRNPSSGSRVGRTDITKRNAAFRNFANAPNHLNATKANYVTEQFMIITQDR